MKALFINPPTGLYVREDRCQSSVDDFAVSVVRPPMDLMLMASSLESIGIVCKIRDYPIEHGAWKNFKDDLISFNPDFLILSITTPTLKDDMAACSIAKEINPAILTIAKGAHFLGQDKIVLDEFKDLDVIIRGENELAIKEVVSSKDLNIVKGITYRENGEIKRTQDRPFLENLDKLPVPARHLVKNNLYRRPDTQETMAIIETNRGCPASCIFCLTEQVSGRKIRARSPEVIIDEIEDCIHKFRIRNFHFKSDTFTWNKKWVISLCQEILKRNLKIKWICNSRVDTLDRERLDWMKKAGCFAIGLGIESGNQEILNKIKKGITLKQSQQAVKLCKEFQVKTYAYFMIGFPWDTQETIDDSLRFAIELDPDFVDFFIAYPFPGTELERITAGFNLMERKSGVRAYAEPLTSTLSLSREKLDELRGRALKKFYLRPKFILKTLFSARSPRVFCNYIYYGIRTLRKIR